MYKITENATQLEKCILFHTYSCRAVQLPAAREKAKTSYSIKTIL